MPEFEENKSTEPDQSTHCDTKPSVTAAMTASFDISNYIPFRLVKTQLRMHGTLKPESAVAENAISRLLKTEFRVLALIASVGPLTPSVIASEYGFDRSVIARTVASLIKTGALVATPLKTDRRSKCISLTSAGRALIEPGIVAMEEYGDYLDQALSAHEKVTLFKLLDKLLVANAQYTNSSR